MISLLTIVWSVSWRSVTDHVVDQIPDLHTENRAEADHYLKIIAGTDLDLMGDTAIVISMYDNDSAPNNSVLILIFSVDFNASWTIM